MVYELIFLFLARTIDMCLSTIRHVLVIRGMRWAAGAIGFFEIMVYTLALALVVGGSMDVFRLLAFSLGFGAGIILGVSIEDRLAFGFRLVQATINRGDAWLVTELRAKGLPVTVHEAEGIEGPKLVLSMVMKRRLARSTARTILETIPDAFVVSTEPKHFLGGGLGSKISNLAISKPLATPLRELQEALAPIPQTSQQTQEK